MTEEDRHETPDLPPKEAATEVRRVSLTPSEARELEDRAARETGGVLTTLIRQALGLPPLSKGRRWGSRSG